MFFRLVMSSVWGLWVEVLTLWAESFTFCSLLTAEHLEMESKGENSFLLCIHLCDRNDCIIITQTYEDLLHLSFILSCYTGNFLRAIVRWSTGATVLKVVTLIHKSFAPFIPMWPECSIWSSHGGSCDHQQHCLPVPPSHIHTVADTMKQVWPVWMFTPLTSKEWLLIHRKSTTMVFYPALRRTIAAGLLDGVSPAFHPSCFYFTECNNCLKQHTKKKQCH